MSQTAEDLRPAAKVMLPFRVLGPSGRGGTDLTYEDAVACPGAGVRKLTFTLSADVRPGLQILELIRAYHRLEGTLDPLVKENEDLRARVAALEGENASLKGQVEEFLGRERQVRPEGQVRRR